MSAALESVVPEPKERSATWLSSTYAVDDESEEAKYCSGGYQVMLHFHVHLLPKPHSCQAL